VRTDIVVTWLSCIIGRATNRKAEIHRIRTSRGAFKWLPVYLENDLVHGSWWMVRCRLERISLVETIFIATAYVNGQVWGSLLGTLVAVVPLIDLYTPFFKKPVNTTLAAFNSSITWILCIGEFNLPIYLRV
jgi:hypothetical protein